MAKKHEIKKTFYVIRYGWNTANQPSAGRPSKPKDQFDSGQYELVAIVQAKSEGDACSQFNGTVYNNQSLFAITNSRSIKGLARAVKEFNEVQNA